MSVMQTRGGFPAYVKRITTSSTPRKCEFKCWTTAVFFRNMDDTDEIQIFFSEEAADAGDDYLSLPAQVDGQPSILVLPLEVQAVWVVAGGNTPLLEICAFQRRG